jgi:hypothetical protein
VHAIAIAMDRPQSYSLTLEMRERQLIGPALAVNSAAKGTGHCHAGPIAARTEEIELGESEQMPKPSCLIERIFTEWPGNKRTPRHADPDSSIVPNRN